MFIYSESKRAGRDKSTQQRATWVTSRLGPNSGKKKGGGGGQRFGKGSKGGGRSLANFEGPGWLVRSAKKGVFLPGSLAGQLPPPRGGGAGKWEIPRVRESTISGA